VLSIRNKKARGAPDAGRRAPAGKDKRAPAGRDKRRLAGDRAPSATQPSAAAQPVASAEGTPSADVAPLADVDPSGNGQQRPSAAAEGPTPGSRRALKNWRVRSRLLLLIGIPTVTAVMLGGIRIDSSAQSALAYQRVVRLANLNGEIIGLVQALQRERQDTITFITLGANGGRAAALSSSSADPALAANARLELKVLYHGDYAASSRAAGQVTSLLSTIGAGYSELTQQDARAAAAAIQGLGPLRTAAARSRLPALVVIQEYTNKINTLLALDDQVAVGSSDSTLADGVRVVGLVSAMKEEASEQQALITAAHPSSLIGLSRTGFTPGIQAAITDAEAEQQANEAAFNGAATASQRQLFNGELSAPTVAGAQAQVQQAISLAPTAAPGPVIANAESSLYDVVSGMRSVEAQLVQEVIARSTALRNGAITDVIISSTVILLVLALALVFTTIIGRSMVRPLRRLRAGALEVAGQRLPETVRRMSETDGKVVSLEVEPIDVDSSDEIGQVARAFDQVHREALRLAATEAALRGNVNAMFVNLSRRSQSLVERQIQLIDELEQGEQDSERLSSLFRMDHLATRMRRNSENLLVLAGHDASRHWNQPVAVVDVLRAAVSEIEQYERVALNVQPGIAVRGQAVSDVVHLTAELVENATSFSPGESPVSIVGHLLSSGGVLLEIADQGVGMGAEELAHANWRLDNPPAVDVAVSRRMGLFVVARLAARHGIRVRLRSGTSGGLTALVWLPDEVVTHEVPGSSPSLGGFDAKVAMGAGHIAGGAGASEFWDTERAAAEQEVNAARAPKFAPLTTDAGDSSAIPRRVPGSGARPGTGRFAAAATGPMPAFRTSPQPSPRPEPFAPGPVPAVGAEALGTTPQPVVGAGQDPVWNVGADQSAAPAVSSAASFESSQPPSLWGSDLRPEPGSAQRLRDGLGSSAGGGQRDWSPGSSGGVVVPAAASLGEEHRLPIFEAVESDWFRRGRPAVSLPGREERANGSSIDNGASASARASASSSPSVSADSGSWSSAGDEGWRAAEAASAPTSGGVTPAGLPKRVPQANLVPGTAAETPAPVLPRSAAATRERFASLQRGIRQARAAMSSDDNAPGEDDGSK
jgi:signal transduction histidine kinase